MTDHAAFDELVGLVEVLVERDPLAPLSDAIRRLEQSVQAQQGLLAMFSEEVTRLKKLIGEIG